MTLSLIPFALLSLLVGCGTKSPSDVPILTATPDAPLSFDEDVSLTPHVVPSFDTDVPVIEVMPLRGVVELSLTAPPSRYTLRRGETLAHFARWSNRPVEEIAASSALDLDGVYPVGTEVALQLTDEERSIVEARRDAHHQLRARNYLSSRGSTVTEFYQVKTGDNAWTIARDQLGMPVWMLESLNPSTNLDRLRPGQELLVPIFQDIVAQAEPLVVEESARIPEDKKDVE